jgi:hypothetical protein
MKAFMMITITSILLVAGCGLLDENDANRDIIEQALQEAGSTETFTPLWGDSRFLSATQDTTGHEGAPPYPHD